jgi:hypothetical protein
MYTLGHRPLMLVRLMRLRARAPVRLLNRVLVLERLPDFEVDLVAVHDVLRHGEDVCDQAVEQVHGHGFADDHAQDLGAVFFGGEGVVLRIGVSLVLFGGCDKGDGTYWG